MPSGSGVDDDGEAVLRAGGLCKSDGGGLLTEITGLGVWNVRVLRISCFLSMLKCFIVRIWMMRALA